MVARASAFASQIVAGYFLTEQQFGTYAIALGIFGLTTLLRGGGAANYMPSIRPEEFDAKAGRFFRWSFAFLITGAVITSVVAALLPELPEKYHLPGLASVLWVLAGRQAIVPFAQIARMRMIVHLRFKELAKLDIANSVMRLGVTAALAMGGYGPLAFAVPLAVSTLTELIYCGSVAGMKRTDFRWMGMSVREMAMLMGWPIALSLVVSVRDMNFLFIKAVVPVATVGLIYFAYQLAGQPSMLLSSSLVNVFAPLLARTRGDRSGETAAMQQFFNGTMLFVPTVQFILIACFPSIERLIWDGKWAAASVPVTALAVGFCFHTAASMLVGPMLGLRQFREVAIFEGIRTLSAVLGALLGAVALTMRGPLGLQNASDGAIVSVCLGASMTVVCAGQLVWIMRHWRIPMGETLRTLFYGPMLALLIAIAARSVGESVVTSTTSLTARTEALLESLVCISLYIGISVIAIRFTAESTLREVLVLLPGRIRHPAERMLGLA